MFSLTIYLHSNGHKKKSDTLYKNTEVQLLEERKREGQGGREGGGERRTARRLCFTSRASEYTRIYIYS